MLNADISCNCYLPITLELERPLHQVFSLGNTLVSFMMGAVGRWINLLSTYWAVAIIFSSMFTRRLMLISLVHLLSL